MPLEQKASKMKPYREPATRYRPPNLANRGAQTPLSLQSHTYDIHTGQVFNETEIKTSKRQASDWIGEFLTPNLVKTRLTNAIGARSLFETAKGTVARQMRGISSQHLSDIPWEIAEQVWMEVVET